MIASQKAPGFARRAQDDNGNSRCERHRLIALRAETQQGSDIACAVEFLTFLDQVQLDIATDRHWNQGIAYIFQFESRAAWA
jgi:hypothetical protein